MKNIVCNYSDQELDEIYGADKITNSFESLTPLLLHELLKREHFGSNHKISQKSLLEKFEDRYETKINRKSLSRTLYTLQVFGLGVVVTREGVFYDPFLDEIIE